MAMGLDGPLCASDLRRIEAHLGQHGGDLQIELCPFADATVSVLLASRGYRVQEFNQVWVRSLDADLPLPREHDAAAARACGFELRPVREGEAQAYARVLLAGFLGQEEQASPELALVFEPMPFVEGTECWLAWVEGEPAGGGSVAVFDGVATLFGTSVLPRFRRRGIQEALIRARLARARALGCDLATSNTQPCTPSQRNMERAGFRVAYPKVVMLRRGVAPCPS
jgi:GNAT superfamily N-acetyltransferase